MQQFKEAIKSHGLRFSKTKEHILQVLLANDHPVSGKDIIDSCCTKIHKSNVYRSLDQLVAVNMIKQVFIGPKISYELSEMYKPHHHHATCESCGTLTSINDSTLEKMLDRATVAAGLKPTKHSFELYGLCKDCQ